MAPSGSLDLPDLPALFSGRESVLSWYDIPVYEWNPIEPSKRNVAYWSTVLHNERTIAQLLRDTPAFESSNPASAKKYESVTAAINVSPSVDKQYNISQIKSDSEWLVKELILDEVEALRITLLEWQNRPSLFLKAGYSEAEIASLSDVYGSQLAFDADFESTAFRLRNEDDFKTDTARRRRQIFIYFQECIGLTRTWLALQDEETARVLGVTDLPKFSATKSTMISRISKCMDLLVKLIKAYVSGPSPTSSVIDDETNYVWQVGTLFHAQFMMQTTIVLARRVTTLSAGLVQSWMRTMADVQFLRTVESSPLISPSQLEQLHSLTSLVTLALIDPANTISQLDVDAQQHWMSDFDASSEVHQILFNAVDQSCLQAVPAAFAWALVLRRVEAHANQAQRGRESPVHHRAIDIGTYDSATGRRASIPGSAEESIFEHIIGTVRAVSPDSNSMAFLLEHTLDTFGVAEILANLADAFAAEILPITQKAVFELLQEVIATAVTELPETERYGSDILTPQFALLNPPRAMSSNGQRPVETCKMFLTASVLTKGILDVAAARFPYEALPFLRLCRQLARAFAFDENGTQYITFRLSELDSFTIPAIGPFEAFHTIREDENRNLVALDQHAYAFPQTSVSLITQGSEQQNSLIIPADTPGVVVSTSEPPVIEWQYRYSGLALVGEWLELYHNGTLQDVLSEHESAIDVATEMILLLANLLTSTNASNVKISLQQKAVDYILEESSAHLHFNSGIVDLIFEIIEQELQAYRRKPSNVFDTGLLCASVSFTRALLQVKPAQFWHHIPKTSLINPHGSTSLLCAVISSVESLSGNAPLAEISAYLYQDMIGGALQHSINLVSGQKWRAKPGSSVLNNSEKLFENILTSMTQNMLEMFESVSQWRPLPPPQNALIISIISNSFSRIVKIQYGLGSSSSKLTSCLEPAAKLIMTHLRPESIGDAKSGPILAHLMGLMGLEESFRSTLVSDICHQALINLSYTLVITSKAHNLEFSGLEPCLFDLLPILIRNLKILPSDNQHNASQLLQMLLTAVTEQKPVSLLGHLGSNSCIELVNILNSTPYAADISASADAWKLLRSLISKEQQWLSVVILTGTVPDRSGESRPKDQRVYRGELVINNAFDFLEKINASDHQDQMLMRPVLDFVIAAQQNWSWILSSVNSRKEVFGNLVRYVSQTSHDNQTRLDADRRFNIALITDLSSVHLQHAKSVRDVGLMKVFIPLVEWLTTNAIDVASYKASMHINLSKNFSAKFGLELSEFKNNRLMVSREDDFYNENIVDLVFGNDPAWKSSGNRSHHTNQSYHAEVRRANENLQIVESELNLLLSFQKLCIEHAAFFVQDVNVQKTMAHITQRCLIANATKHPSEQLFDTLLRTRYDIALALTQRLVEKRVRGSDFRELLKPAWESALFNNASYDQAVLNDDLENWRTSLMIVLLALQFHLGSGWKPLGSKSPSSGDLLKHSSSIIPQIIEIATVIIGQGLSTIVSVLQEQKQAQMQQQPRHEHIDIGVRDIALILNTLETILRMSRLPDFAEQLSDRLISTGTIRSATKLYMWSHLLAGPETDNDPIYAVYAIQLLVSLSSLPAVAEEMAVEGVLNSILTARVTQALQRVAEGAGNMDRRPHCRMLYTVWAEGLLPMSLNMLHGVSAPITAEITTFLNAFPEQLARASSAFRPREGEFITLGMAKEVATLSLLSFILDDYRNAGASAAVEPASILLLTGFDEHKKVVAADVKEHFELDTGVLKSKIVPLNDKELAQHQNGELTTRVLGEMKMAITCLNSADGVESIERSPAPAHGFRTFGD